MKAIKNLIKQLINILNFTQSLNTITTKLLMLFLFMTIIPLIVLAQFSTDLINSNMTQRAKSQLQLNVKIAQSEYMGDLKNLKNIVVQGISTALEETYFAFLKGTSRNVTRKKLIDISKKSDLGFLFIVDRNKKLVVSANSNIVGTEIKSFDSIVEKALFSGEPISSTEIFLTDELRKEGEKLISQAEIIDLGTQKKVLTGLCQVVAFPIYDDNREIVAIAIAGKILSKDYRIADSIGEMTGATFMIAQILENNEALVISTNLTTEKGNRAIGKLISAETVNSVYGFKQIQGREWQIREFQLANYYPILNLDGNIIGLVYLGIPEEQFTLLAKQNVWLVGLISIIGLFSAIFLSAVFSRSITTPILKLADAAQKISLGDLSIRVNVKGSSEISQTGAVFNLMAENLQREERLRDDFVATLTHDLKVPLLAENQTITYMIKGSYGEINDEQKEVLEVIKHTNESTLDMVNTLLEVYRYDAGKNVLLKSVLDIRELIKTIAHTLSPLAEEKNIDLTVNVPDEKIMVSVDEREIKRVIHNLLANAISSTLRRGKISIVTSLYKYKKQYDPQDKEFRLTTLRENIDLKDYVIISVYDTGIGMEKEDMDNLFRRFSSSKGRKPSSIGLGLYYSYQVITAHDGLIWAESQEGVGSVFKFTLPLLKKGE